MKTSEAQFINKIKKLVQPYGKNVIMGIGDDAAVFKGGVLASCDVQVEDVHFKRNRITPDELGQRAIAAALSDIAAVGGIPESLLLSLGIPQRTEQPFIDRLFKGIRKACTYYKIDLVGGNLSRTSKLFIDCFVLGKTVGKPLLRSGAALGDRVLLTGTLGKRQMIPTARVREGLAIANSGLATSMIDISDGLSTDISHICDASNVGVRIFTSALPRQSKAIRIEDALHRGEDYELCFTTPQKYVQRLIADVRRKTGTKVTIIGEILKKSEGRWVVDEKGRAFLLEAKGWDHFGRLGDLSVNTSKG